MQAGGVVGSDKGEEIGASGSDKWFQEVPCQEVMLGPGSGPDVRCQHRAQKGHSDSIDHREINY